MKEDRIVLRASQEERHRLLEASAFNGMSLSAFLRQAALEKADETLKNRDIITLSDRDRDIFLDALENPPSMNKHLRQAFDEYEKRKHIKTRTKAKKIKAI